MYSVYLNGNDLIYSTSISSLEISNVNLTRELGKAESFEFTIYPNHPCYYILYEMVSIITVYYESSMIFRGRILNIEYDINSSKKVICEGDLSYLMDSLIEPHEYTGTLYGYFKYLISQHNLKLDASKAFIAGFIVHDAIYNYHVIENDYKTAWELLKSHFCFNGAYLHLEYTGDGVELNVYDESIVNFASQDIRFGINLVNIDFSTENENLFTAIIPLGARVGDTEQRLTIKSVNNNIDYLVNQSLASEYGMIFKQVVYDDITDASTLYTLAYDYINSIYKHFSSEIVAVDMSFIDDSVTPFRLNDNVDVYCEHIFSVNPQQFLIKKIEIDIQNPANNKVYAGLLRKGITDIASGSSSTTVINQEASQPYLIDSGTTGIWTWAKYSDGTAECFGKINVQAVSTGSSIGSWYRTAEMYGSTDYPYPITFSEAPATTIQFHTRNGNGALVWTFSVDAEHQKQYLPQCYLIRPTQSTNIYGNINIISKGKYDTN